jgi:hypothetical protein
MYFVFNFILLNVQYVFDVEINMLLQAKVFIDLLLVNLQIFKDKYWDLSKHWSADAIWVGHIFRFFNF